MSLRLLDVPEADLRTLVAHDPTNQDAVDALRWHTRNRVWKRIPAPRGTWRGRRVVLDCKGPMATGYWGFDRGGGGPPVETWDEIVRDPPTPLEERMRRLLEVLV